MYEFDAGHDDDDDSYKMHHERMKKRERGKKEHWMCNTLTKNYEQSKK